MKEELEWMCNEGVVAKLKALSQYLSWETEKNYEKVSEYSAFLRQRRSSTCLLLLGEKKRPVGLWDIEAPSLSIQLAHRWQLREVLK
jgi:hypothetical protein